LPRLLALAVTVVVWALSTGASVASAADCSPPSWLKAVDVKQTALDVVGSGKGPTPELARREARRAMALKIARPRLGEILALQQVKDTVNRKVYTKDDLLKATALAVALNVKTTKRLAEAVVCKTHYAALSANVKGVLAQLKQNRGLGDEINAALIGKIDPLEDQRDAQEAAAAAQLFAFPDQTAKRLALAADAVGDEDLLSAEMRRLLRKKAARLRDGIEQKAKIAKLEEDARDGEKLITAAKELTSRNYVALFEMLNARASGSEEESQFMVGYMYSEALGVKRDDQEALAMLKRAASKNHGPAKVLIGVMTYSGRGTKADQKGAVNWLDSARGDGWTCELNLVQCSR
jgi:hypothetical protein